MDREKIDGWCEKGILGLVLGILVLGPLMFGAQGAVGFLVLQALTIGVIALWVARFWIHPHPKILWPPICWVVLAFVIYAAVRYLQTDVEYVARHELLRILVYGFLFFVIVNNLHRQESTQMITLTLLFLGMVISCYAIYQFLTKSERVWNVDNSVYDGRGSGTFIYPNHLAGFLEMLLPVAICMVLIGRYGHVMKIFLGYAALTMVVAIGSTLSRGGWLVTGFTLVVLCGVLVAQRDYRLQGVVMLVVLMIGAAIVVPRVQAMRARVQNSINNHKSDDLRLAVWQPAISIWQDHFWFGAGPAQFDYRFPAYRPMQVQSNPNRAHNDYLNTLADWGVTGLGIVAAGWVLLYWGVFSTWRDVRGGRDDFSRKKSSKFALLIGASVGLLACLAHCLVDFILHIPANAILCVTLMAMLSSQWRFATERFWFRAGIALRCIATLTLLAGAVYLGLQEYRTARETLALRQASRNGAHPNEYSYEHIHALEAAFAADPMNFQTSYAIAECYRQRSFLGGDNYAELARKAMDWYQRGMKLNPHDGYNWLGYGMCLDQLAPPGVPADSDSYYEQAEQLRPNDYFVCAYTGWHYVQTGDLAAARSWFERSRELEWVPAKNQVTFSYLPIVERRIREATEEHKLQAAPRQP